MGRAGGKFIFPASRYYAKSTEFKRKLDDFSNEIDTRFFQVVSRNLTNLHSQDQQYLEGVLAYSRGKAKLNKLNSKYIPKWNNMQTENSNNPMHLVLEADQEHKRNFVSLKDEQLKSRLTQQYEIKVQEAFFVEIQKMSKEEISKKFGDMKDIFEEVLGSDWYSRLKDASSLADFINNFSEKFDDLAKHHPTKAAILLKVMEQSDGFTKMLRESENFVRKLKSSKHMQAVLTLASKPEKLLQLAWELGDKKLLKFLHKSIEYLAESKLAKKVIGAGVRFGWAGAIASIGIHGYYNVKDERVWSDFTEGRAARGTVKAVAGTAIDMAKNFGVIDGLIVGAVVGGAIGGTVTIPAFGIGAVPAAVVGAVVGGVVGGINQGLQFLFPKMYDNIKTRAFKAVDWTADMAIKVGKGIKAGYNTVKTTASKVISHAKSKVNEFGNAVQRGIDKTKKVIETGKRALKLWDSVKKLSNPFKKPSPSY